MTPVAPRIGNDVSYVRTIQQSSHFSWQVQYLVKFKSRIMLGSWSDRPRIGNDVSPVFGDFL